MERGVNIFSNTMADMKYTDIEKAAGEGAAVLIPIGVMEQHGPHLCLATDIYTAHIHCLNVREILSEKGCPAIIAPPFFWGICQASRGFAGSFEIRMETAQALLFDMIASLKAFGFARVFGITGHNDVEHKIACLNAFKRAHDELGILAAFPFEEELLAHFGLTRDDPHLYFAEPSQISVSCAKVQDVHAGDIETALIDAVYPDLVDGQAARALPDVELGERFEGWMFGGQLSEISPRGYIGSPKSYEGVDIQRHMRDVAQRLCEGILARMG